MSRKGPKMPVSVGHEHAIVKHNNDRKARNKHAQGSIKGPSLTENLRFFL